MEQYLPDIAGGMMNAYGAGIKLRQNRKAEADQARLQSLAPDIFSGDANATAQAYAIDPKTAQKYTQGADRIGLQVHNISTQIQSYVDAGHPELAAALYQQALPTIKVHFPNAPAQFGPEVMTAIKAIGDATQASGAGVNVQSTYIDDQGQRVAVMRNGTRQVLGGAQQNFTSIVGQDANGNPTYGGFNAHSNTIAPTQINGPGAAQPPATQVKPPAGQQNQALAAVMDAAEQMKAHGVSEADANAWRDTQINNMGGIPANFSQSVPQVGAQPQDQGQAATPPPVAAQAPPAPPQTAQHGLSDADAEARLQQVEAANGPIDPAKRAQFKTYMMQGRMADGSLPANAAPGTPQVQQPQQPPPTPQAAVPAFRPMPKQNGVSYRMANADEVAAAGLPVGTKIQMGSNGEYKMIGGAAGAAASGDVAKTIADGIANGDQPPVTTGLYKYGATVRAELEKRGFNLTKANQDWVATQKLYATMNGAQQVRLREAVGMVKQSIPLVRDLVTQWDAGGFPPFNKARMIAAKNGALGPKAQSIATRLDTEIADMTSESAVVIMGGNSPTDHGLQLAAKQFNGDWSKQVFMDSLGQFEQNINYRDNSIRNLGTSGITQSNYNQGNPTQGLGNQPQSSQDFSHLWGGK